MVQYFYPLETQSYHELVYFLCKTFCFVCFGTTLSSVQSLLLCQCSEITPSKASGDIFNSKDQTILVACMQGKDLTCCTSSLASETVWITVAILIYVLLDTKTGDLNYESYLWTIIQLSFKIIEVTRNDRNISS